MENKELTVKYDKYVQYDFNGNGGAVDFLCRNGKRSQSEVQRICMIFKRCALM